MEAVPLSPAKLAGVTRPGGVTLSPEATDVIDRLREFYRTTGKASAAHNYPRHMKAFFGWCEGLGYSIRALPADSLESFLASLRAAGSKETTLYVLRTQLKAALKCASEQLGIDFRHMEYQTGKPPEIRKIQKNQEKRKRTERRLVQTAQQLQAIKGAQTVIFGAPAAVPAAMPAAPSAPPAANDSFTDSDSTFDQATPYEDSTMSDQSVPATGGGQGQTANQQPVVVLQVPANTSNRPMNTIANSQSGTNGRIPGPNQPPRGIVINNFTFNAPFIRISYMSDGSNPLTPPGTEIVLQTLPAAMIAPHGDIASFLQSYLIPKMRLSPAVSQVHFIFHELNDKRQPTGKRDELIVSVGGIDVSGGMGMGMGGNGMGGNGMAQSAPQPTQLAGMPYPAAAPAPTNDRMTEFLLQKLDREAEEAKKRADALQEEMKKANDAQTTFLLMQQFRREEDLRKDAEERKRMELDRLDRADRAARLDAAPPPMPMSAPMPFPTILPPEQPRDTGAAEFAKALAESQKNMMELVLATLNKPVPPPPPPPVQKDAAEWLMPFIAQMNQQSQQQQQANQQMLVGIMQANQQFMQALLTRENPMEKLLYTQLQEVKAVAAAPKADELESFADKLQKMKMVSDMLGGGSGNGGMIAELLANADVIGAGAAKVIAAAKSGGPAGGAGMGSGMGQMNPALTQPTVPQLTAGAAPASTPTIPPPPEAALAQLKAVVAGVDTGDDQAVINGVVEIVKAFMAAPEPYPSTGRKILAAFKNADDEGELYTLAKNLWTVLGQQYDRPAAKSVAKVLAKWYSIVHQQIFGEPKELMADGVSEGDEDFEDDGSDEGDEVDESDDNDAENHTLVAGG